MDTDRPHGNQAQWGGRHRLQGAYLCSKERTNSFDIHISLKRCETETQPLKRCLKELPVSDVSPFFSKVGGFDGASRLRSAEAYNPANNVWHTVPSMLTPRSNFGIEVVDDLLFVVGGFNSIMTIFNVERYDDNAGEWSEADEMEIPRSAVSCCVLHGLPNMAEYAPHPAVEDVTGDQENLSHTLTDF